MTALSAALALLAAIFSGGSAVFYAWLNAAEPTRWPADKATLWAYSSLALAVVFLLAFGVASLVAEANQESRRKQKT